MLFDVLVDEQKSFPTLMACRMKKAPVGILTWDVVGKPCAAGPVYMQPKLDTKQNILLENWITTNSFFYLLNR